MKSKKAQIGYFPRFILRFIALVVILGIVLALVYIISNKPVDSREAEALALWTRIMYVPGGLCKTNPNTGKVMIGIVNPDVKNSQEPFEQIYESKAPQSQSAARITILDAGRTRNITKPLFVNKLGFENYYPLAAKRVKGPGSATLYTREYPMVIEGKNNYVDVIAKFEIVVPHVFKK